MGTGEELSFIVVGKAGERKGGEMEAEAEEGAERWWPFSSKIGLS